MIICFQCSPETKKTLDNLLEKGQYRDIGEVITSAVENLNVLQAEIGDQGTLVIESGQRDKKKSSAATGQEITQTNHQPIAVNRIVAIPDLFTWTGKEKKPELQADLPIFDFDEEDEVPINEWIFGQYNKLLPVKASCRALAHLFDEFPDGVPAVEGAIRIASEAANLGEYLVQHDEQHGLVRDDRLSTAFPRPGNEHEKGRARYANQFVAYVNSSGEVWSLLMALKLINQTDEEKPRLLLTEPGWEFAAISNPVLDFDQAYNSQRFTEKEKNFLIDQIAKSVPIEDFAYQSILQAIKNGANTPDSLDKALLCYISEEQAQNINMSYVSTQRSGAVSRMTDLGLIKRIRAGIRVKYSISETGIQYLNS